MGDNETQLMTEEKDMRFPDLTKTIGGVITALRNKGDLPNDRNLLLGDIGGYTGRLAKRIKEYLEYGVNYICLDPLYTKKGMKKTNLQEELNYVTGLGERLPFADGSLDVVTAIDSIHHSDEPFDVIREMYRVVKPGGFIIIKDHNPRGVFGLFAAAISDVLGNTNDSREKKTQILDIFKRLFRGNLGAIYGRKSQNETDVLEHVQGKREGDVEMSFRYIRNKDWKEILKELGASVNKEHTVERYRYKTYPNKLIEFLGRFDIDHCFYVIQKPLMHEK